MPFGSGEMPLRRSLPQFSASPVRCLVAGPSVGSTDGSSASTKPSDICVFAVDGESRVSPNTPTAPPPDFTSASLANDVSS